MASAARFSGLLRARRDDRPGSVRLSGAVHQLSDVTWRDLCTVWAATAPADRHKLAPAFAPYVRAI